MLQKSAEASSSNPAAPAHGAAGVGECRPAGEAMREPAGGASVPQGSLARPGAVRGAAGGGGRGGGGRP